MAKSTGADPSLVVRDADGRPYIVRYDAVNATLLNEFLKEHRKVENLEATVVAGQQRQIKALMAGLQQLSDQVESSRSSPQIVKNDSEGYGCCGHVRVDRSGS